MRRMVLSSRVRLADRVAKGDSGPSSSANSKTFGEMVIILYGVGDLFV